jgi:very-short-patch-repair endonuclease
VSRFIPNNWRAIRAFYRAAQPYILEAGANEWGMDPYEWSQFGMVHLTPIEEWLWSDIRACDAVLYPQFPVMRYFADFANPVAKVAIECDGAAFHDEKKDEIRDRNLRDAGWTVYRFPGWMCRTDSDEETGAPGEARRLMREICDRHGIGRFSRTAEQDRRLERGRDLREMLIECIDRSAAIRAAVKEGR